MNAGRSAPLVLSRLQDAKLVARPPAESDRRRVLVSATAASRRALRQSPRPPTEQLLKASDQLTPAQAEHIARGLEPLLHRMHRGLKPEHLLFE